MISLGNPSEIGTKLPKDNEQEGKMVAKAKSSGTGSIGLASKASEGVPAPTNPERGSEKQTIIAASKQHTTARTAGGIFNTEGNGSEEQQASSPSIVNAGSNVEPPNSQGQRRGNMPSSPPNKPFPLAKIDKANDDDSIESRGDNNGQRSSTPSTLNGADTNPQRSPDYAKAQGPSGPKGPNNSNNGNTLENKERQGDSTNAKRQEKSGKDAMEAGKGQENEVEEKSKSRAKRTKF